MFWSIYQWLWPLFAPCSSFTGTEINYETPLRITDGRGYVLYDSGGWPLELAVRVCPTPTMDVLLALALLGLVLGVAALFWLLVRARRKSPDQIVEDVVQELDRATLDFLRKI